MHSEQSRLPGIETPDKRLESEIKDLRDNLTFADGARRPEQHRRLVHALFEEAYRGGEGYDTVRAAVSNNPTNSHEEHPDLTFQHEQ